MSTISRLPEGAAGVLDTARAPATLDPVEIFADAAGHAPPLVLSSYTLGTAVPFAERVRAAAGAGFDGIGLRAENYWDATATGLDDAAMADIAARHGVRIMEVEYLTGWGTAADRDEAQQAKEGTVLHLARTFGVGHLNAGLLEHLPVEVITAAFAALCDRAGPDLTVALEFMPYSGIPDLATAWRVLQGAGRSNSALLLDVWHWARAGMTAANRVPADQIVAVRLCNVLEHPMDPPRAESLGHRLPPGHGYGDAVGLVRELHEKGVRPRIVAVEVISDDLVSQGVDVAAHTVAGAAREVLSAARTTCG